MRPVTTPRKNCNCYRNCSTRVNSSTRVLGQECSPQRLRMTHRMEATVQNLLSTRAITNIGTWHIRTMFETGKTAQVSTETRRYNIAVLGLCETRWTQSRQIRLSTGETLLYSGHEEDSSPHTEGVRTPFCQCH